MDIRFNIMIGIFFIIITACGKSPEERRIETLESQASAAQKREDDFNRVFREALTLEQKYDERPNWDAMPLTILAGWRLDLALRRDILEQNTLGSTSEKYSSAKRINEEIQNALQWTETALKEVNRYTQLFYEASYLKNTGNLNDAFYEKLSEADKLHQKLEASIRISENQEKSVEATLAAFEKERVAIEALEKEIAELTKQINANKDKPELAAKRKELIQRMIQAKKELNQLLPPQPGSGSGFGFGPGRRLKGN